MSCVGEVMVTCPTVHGASATVGQLRTFFSDHVHAALLVNGDELVGVVERTDLTADLGDETPARLVAMLEGRTVDPGASKDSILESMNNTATRRLAVVSAEGVLLGLLCLKASGLGFCSDADVRSRRRRSK
ncbi:MAG TPA: hypothetical protein VGL76_08765 [Gaiellaceae bacterium]